MNETYHIIHMFLRYQLPIWTSWDFQNEKKTQSNQILESYLEHLTP